MPFAKLLFLLLLKTPGT
jgi:hypothetical protein